MLELVPLLATFFAPLQESAGEPAISATAAAALGVGIAGLGAGIAERGIGAAAVGAMAEDRSFIGIGILMTVLPETIIILAIVVIFLV